MKSEKLNNNIGQPNQNLDLFRRYRSRLQKSKIILFAFLTISHLASFLKNYRNVFFTEKVKTKVLFSIKRYFLGSIVSLWEKASGWGLGLALGSERSPARPRGLRVGSLSRRSPGDRKGTLAFSSFNTLKVKAGCGGVKVVQWLTMWL